jgi:hypothetical protein
VSTQWNPIQGAIQAYRTRRATSGESAELTAIRVALAAGALDILGPLGLEDALPRWDGEMLRGFSSDPPFWFTRPIPESPYRFEQVTLGGDVALGAVPGGEVVLHVPLDCCVALGPSNGDIAELTRRNDDWLFNLAWFFSLNRELGGLVDRIAVEHSQPVTQDIKWGGDWYCLRWPVVAQLRYIMPAMG